MVFEIVVEVVCLVGDGVFFYVVIIIVFVLCDFLFGVFFFGVVVCISIIEFIV